MMKKLFLATTALVALAAGAANAADLPVAYKAPPPVRPACAQFGGFYVGGNVGWGYYDHRWNDRDAWSSENSDDLQRSNVGSSNSGFLGGVQGGYNWQSGCTVFGFEVDYAWGKINHETLETDGDVGINTDSLTIQSRLRGMGSLRTRAGVVVDSVLIYVTGGLAFADFSRTYTQTDLNAPASEVFAHSKSRWGWAAGFGTEWAITSNWSLKSEVLYNRFEKDDATFTCAVFCGAPESKRFDNQDSVWVTRVGINYRFGGGRVF
jgi:outer membrane immunogenic protein